MQMKESERNAELFYKYWSNVHYAAKGLPNKEDYYKLKIWELAGKPCPLESFKVPAVSMEVGPSGKE